MSVAIDKGLHSTSNRFVYIAAAISALGGMLFGYDTGVISGAILFIQQDFALSPTIIEIVVSSVVLGAMLGAVVGGTLTDRFGRRIVLIVTAALFALGAVGTALAPTVFWLVVGRVIVGMAIGVASFTTPLYISEISPVTLRGRSSHSTRSRSPAGSLSRTWRTMPSLIRADGAGCSAWQRSRRPCSE